MRRLSAQYVITNTGILQKRAVITVNNDGLIVRIDETKGELRESQSVEFYNGIIIPGFVNCHCHLELSHLKGSIPGGTGLPDFIMHIRNSGKRNGMKELRSAAIADKALEAEGVVLCADICNTPLTFGIKKKSSISYINLLEVFGIDPDKAERRMNEIAELEEKALEAGLEYAFTPHSFYSVSQPLFSLIRKKTAKNRISSVHFLESDSESMFLDKHTGPLRDSYRESGLLPQNLMIPGDHVSAVIDELTPSGNLILVHNTYADNQTVRRLKKRRNIWWCLCPGSNLFIENKMPPVEMLRKEGCEIVIGTDSLASNNELSILSEMKHIHRHFPSIPLEELVRWATFNGARALGEEKHFGKIEAGMKPGLLLIENIDLENFKLLPGSSVKRLI